MKKPSLLRQGGFFHVGEFNLVLQSYTGQSVLTLSVRPFFEWVAVVASLAHLV